MILRRITEHVKAQNWFAITLDFLIVIVGVFIGIQVSNWNDGQAAKQRGADYAERLVIDMRTDIKGRRELVAYYDEVNASAERTLDILTGENPAPDAQTLVVNAYRATEYSSYAQTRATWDEVVSSGEVRLLPRSAVENGLSFYFTADIAEQARTILEASAYRRRVRRLMPHKVQQAIREGCSDVRDDDFTIGGFHAECRLDLSDDAIAAAADLLLNDPELLPDLQYQVSHLANARSNLRSDVFVLERIIRVLEGGQAIAKEAQP